MSRSRPPLKEIAKSLEVSPATISLVLHNRPGVSDETRFRIVEQLKEHGYIEDKAEAQPRSIHLLKYSVLGYHTGKNDTYTNTILDAITLEARKKNYEISITSCHEGEFQKVLEMIMALPLDGMILLGTDLPLVYENYLVNYRKPVVIVDTYMPGCGRDCVVIDNRQCIRTALEHLAVNGHRKIGFVYSGFRTFNYMDRHTCFLQEMRQLDLEVHPDYIFPVNPLMERTYKDIIYVMEQSGGLPTAIVADNDTIAVGMFSALKNNGYRIPADVSIVGIGDTVYCRLSAPGITVVQIQADYIGRSAILMMDNRISSPGSPVSKISISGELAARGSVLARGQSAHAAI